MTVTTLENYIGGKKPRIEEALGRLFGGREGEPAARVYEAMDYALMAGGKRLRPVLVMATAEAIRPRPPALLKAALATELVHTSSLILDDLPSMDNATLRRGRPATHKVFGEATAILAANGLLMEAFALVADNAREADLGADAAARAVHSLAKAVGPEGMIGGQEVDLEVVGRPAGFETLEFICSRKTGALFTACVQLGGIFSRARDFEMEALENYAKNLGLAFQVRDDVLDAIGSREKLGKDVHQDSNRTTFASQFGVESARKAIFDLCRVAEESLAALPRRPEPLVALARHVATVEE